MMKNTDDIIPIQNRLTKQSNVLKAIERRIPYNDLRKKLGRNWERPWLTQKEVQ